MAKILYVEDNEDNIYMLKLRLERRGYHLLIAKDGLEGIKAAERENPDLILMDVGLPLMDGYKATKILKASPRAQNIPIIILSAHALVTDIEKAKETGADDFEAKPVNITNLINKIENLIKKNVKD